jgi:hypothetical protein
MKRAQRSIAFDQPNVYGLRMKLGQGQLWKQGKEYIRIVRLERLEVEYKSLTHPASKEGTKHITSKKDFCRLLKQARLLSPAGTAESESFTAQALKAAPL